MKRAYAYFNVLGAGQIRLSEKPHMTGGKSGVGIGVSWGKHDYAGGVLTTKELKCVVRFLSKKLAELEAQESPA